MAQKKLIAAVFIKDETAYTDATLKVQVNKDLSVKELCVRLYENGADAIVYSDLSYDDESHEKAILNLREICKEVDIPVYATGNIKRVEDVKKYLYAGAKAALMDASKESNLAMLTEVTNRFGKDKVGVYITEDAIKDVYNLIKDNCNEEVFSVESQMCNISGEAFLFTDKPAGEVLIKENCRGVISPCFAAADMDFMELKNSLKEQGIEVNTFSSAIPFSEFKLNSDGLIPVVVQDYATDEVLMMAYMNEESYNLTLKTGRMTYYSRSRKEIWLKGLTSGHYQYVISLALDCDNDTILAKVRQVGAACHTGAHSCFFRELASKEMNKTNPLKVLKDVMAVIEDRKIHPKEGSYTNYLFDKGIDKILKKVGEEATEIVIAAKNPDPVEIKYEIADFLYHVMVLMAERGLDWDEIMEELANR
ncbi:MAG: bifunctional phosphoribosyl-AMP cyclohydrolase/phosphoribosyl-ATP diphosphatase HisIE [Butyrivibrio sp.]